jgi:predicted MFS family arabinose efflux permease
MFIWGLAVFVLASLWVGLVETSNDLIAARVMQGVGAAVLAPSTLSLLDTSFVKQPQRGRALAIYGSITGIGTSVGLVLGGWITGTWDWRWAFLANVPLGLVLIVGSLLFLTETEKSSAKIDVFGALFSTIGMTSIVYGLIQSAEVGWNEIQVWIWLVGGILFMLAFVAVESKVHVPLVPLRLFRSAQRSGANIARALFVGSMSAFWFYVSQFLQVSKGLSPLQTGLAFLPMTLASFGIAFLVPSLSRRFGDAPFLAGGLATVAVGTLWLSRFTEGGSYFWEVALPMILVGLGQGASTIRLTSAGIAGVRPEDSGAASGLVSTHVQLGTSLGLSLLIALTASVPITGLDASTAITNQANLALLGGGIFCLFALITVLLFVLPKKHMTDYE